MYGYESCMQFSRGIMKREKIHQRMLPKYQLGRPRIEHIEGTNSWVRERIVIGHHLVGGDISDAWS